MPLRPLLAATLGTWLLVHSAVAHADPAAAEALFQEGRALLDRGELAPACEKLEASQALEPSAGTQLNLAACRLKQGKTATAWAHFVSAERLARNQSRPEQVLEAKQRAAELRPQLSTLTLLVPEPAANLELRRDGQLVLAATFGSPMPVDPGVIVIEASAPGYEAARLEVTIGASADRQVLTLPALRKVVAQAAPPSASTDGAAARPRSDSSSVLPWAIGGVGGAALVTGGVLGALALSSNSKAIDACDQGQEAECTKIQGRRDDQALVSTVCVGVGLVGVGVAAIWLLTGHSASPESAWTYQGEVTRESALVHLKVGF